MTTAPVAAPRHHTASTRHPAGRLCAAALWLAAATPLAAQAPAEDPMHQQLRKLRAEVVKAIESRDIDTMLQFAHPEIVVTWQNGEACHGREELKAFYQRMGRDAFLRFKVPHEADRLTVLHGGDTGVCAGRVVGVYSLGGKEFELESRWTATLVRQDDRWLVAGYHISLDALDNPLLDAAKGACWIAGGAGLAVGLLLAIVTCRLRRRTSAAPA